jgi:hypothetical protein
LLAVCAAAGCGWIAAIAPAMASADKDDVRLVVDLIMSNSSLGAFVELAVQQAKTARKRR